MLISCLSRLKVTHSCGLHLRPLHDQNLRANRAVQERGQAASQVLQHGAAAEGQHPSVCGRWLSMRRFPDENELEFWDAERSTFKSFEFERVFLSSSTQEEVFDDV